MRKLLVGSLVITGTFLHGSLIELNALVLDTEKDKILVSGDTIGLSVSSGVEVIGTFGVKTEDGIKKPWQNTSIQKGDKILSINGEQVESIIDVKNSVTKAKETKVTIQLDRNGLKISETIDRVKKENGDYTIGLYIKDKILGVGTLTYIIKDEGIFGSLGHNLNASLGDIDGYLIDADLVSVKKAENGIIGEKKARITNDKLGTIEKNTSTGIHGHINSNYDLNELAEYQVAKKEEVREGTAYILANVDGSTIEKFEIEIFDLKIQKVKDTKSFKIKVKDKSLLDKTGGIIQGMSGSPIIQNNKIVGAVTHVFINNPDEGYGIYIEWMLDDMGVDLK